MATTAKKGSKKAIVVKKKVKDRSNDVFFVKKAKAMETLLKKYGTSAAHS